jgi:peptidoglycan/xylan/chitin deacetylase (PgdA/CDA1 family)
VIDVDAPRETGTVVISVDAELSWGFHDLHPLTDSQERRVFRSRETWKRLVELFDAYDVPATWAVVGLLLSTEIEIYHRDHPFPRRWFAIAESGAERNPDLWQGADLIEAVAGSGVDHEIGSHSFSHVIFDEVDRELAAAECQLARAIGRDNGFDFESFVFPRNAIAHRDVLAEYGFTCYRGNRPTILPWLPGAHGLAMMLGYGTRAVGPPTVVPSVDEYGLVDVPASMFLGGFRDRPWSTLSEVGPDPATVLARRGIEKALERGEIFHLWLHPNDLTERRYVKRVRDVLALVDAKRRREGLRVETMGEVASNTGQYTRGDSRVQKG